ncbi:MAG: cell division protein FtsZ [Nitrososphaerota archaeon]|nr:cell division protein FtsZ [Candidatus Bathyarchaeota archaeon]MDW8048297.1 cell division protein FtsZ [Nitrososphaerota archaeon]
MEKSVEEIVKRAVSEKTIEDIAREAIPAISVLGVGGAGCNIVSWMKEKEVAGAKIYALNSDAKHLSITKADKRVLLGYNVTGGLGCGGFPEMGSKAAEESAEEIERLIAGSGLVFITAGLGGGTGTGASPVVAKIAKDMGALTLAVVTIPFQVERARLIKAKEGLSRLVEACDAVIVIDNNRLRKVAGNLPLSEAFGVANELIATFIKNISETIAIPSLVNLDFADLKAIMTGSGVCAMGVGEGMGDTKVEDSIEKALNTQLLDIGDIKKCEGALVHIEGGDDMTLEDVTRAGEIVVNRISPTARVSWGARVNSKMQGSMRATVVLAGVESPFLVEGLAPFGGLKPAGEKLEVEVAKQPPAEAEKKKGLFGRMFG